MGKLIVMTYASLKTLISRMWLRLFWVFKNNSQMALFSLQNTQWSQKSCVSLQEGAPPSSEVTKG